MYNQGYNVYTHTSHTDVSTDLSWDGQSPILWQQWKREGLGREELEGREGKVIKCCVRNYSSLVPRPPPRFYLAAVEKNWEIKSGQRPGDEARITAHVHIIITLLV